MTTFIQREASSQTPTARALAAEAVSPANFIEAGRRDTTASRPAFIVAEAGAVHSTRDGNVFAPAFGSAPVAAPKPAAPVMSAALPAQAQPVEEAPIIITDSLLPRDGWTTGRILSVDAVDGKVSFFDDTTGKERTLSVEGYRRPANVDPGSRVCAFVQGDQAVFENVPERNADPASKAC